MMVRGNGLATHVCAWENMSEIHDTRGTCFGLWRLLGTQVFGREWYLTRLQPTQKETPQRLTADREWKE